MMPPTNECTHGADAYLVLLMTSQPDVAPESLVLSPFPLHWLSYDVTSLSLYLTSSLSQGLWMGFIIAQLLQAAVYLTYTVSINWALQVGVRPIMSLLVFFFFCKR